MQDIRLERSGAISTGKTWRLTKSAKDATEGRGTHLVLVVDGNESASDLTTVELAELDALPRQLMHQLRWELQGWQGRVEINHGLGSQAHYHAHLILVPPGTSVRRCVDSILR